MHVNLSGVYTCGVGAAGEEAQDCWPGAKRPGHHHGYRTEGRGPVQPPPKGEWAKTTMPGINTSNISPWFLPLQYVFVSLLSRDSVYDVLRRICTHLQVCASPVYLWQSVLGLFDLISTRLCFRWTGRVWVWNSTWRSPALCRWWV